MKILYDCTILSNYNNKNGYRAGLFFTAINLLNEFQKQGHEIGLYCNFTEYYKIKHIKEFQKFYLIPEFSILNRIAAFIFYILSFFPVKLQPYITILTRIYTKYMYIKSKKKKKYIEKFDVYFSPFTPPSKELEYAKIKKFRMIHDVIPLIENGLNPKHKDWMFWYNRVYNTINDKDFYVTNSEYTKKDLLEFYPDINQQNVKVTLLGANDNFKIVNDKSVIKKYNLPEKYIFSLCSLGKRKNLVFAIENFYKFIEKNHIDDLELVLAGGIWQKFEKELHDTLAKHDFSKIKLIGYAPDEDLPALYSNALMFIFPSLYEGFGLPVLEAMQCGCPVITSNTSSLPEVIGDAGIQISPTNDEEMVKAYEKMYFDSVFREECRQKGLERAKQFSWEKCAKEIIEFIKSKLN